jgi:hypothetical protein
MQGAATKAMWGHRLGVAAPQMSAGRHAPIGCSFQGQRHLFVAPWDFGGRRCIAPIPSARGGPEGSGKNVQLFSREPVMGTDCFLGTWLMVKQRQLLEALGNAMRSPPIDSMGPGGYSSEM